MFDSMKDDISRNGLVSNILKRLADFETFMRNHQTVNHGIKDFVDVTAWTPVVVGSTVAGVGTYTTQLGEYSRIGKVVFFECSLTWTAHTGTGNLGIGGLPLVSANNGITSPVTIFWRDFTLAVATNKLLAVVVDNSDSIALFEIAGASTTNLPMDSAGQIRLSGFYFVD